jgi:drug/metabolite transporter (DMT)-like permease
MIVELVGTAGACLLLLAYFLSSTGRIAADSTPGNLLNLCGAAMLGVNAVAHSAMPPAALNLVWAVIALVALFRQRARAAARGSDDPTTERPPR